MPQRFEALTERLLKAGIAPRHVRRTVGELEDHLDDLIAMQNKRGYDGDDALLRARALLGSDEELTAAVTASGRFRSLTARAPWLVFGILPPVAVVAVLLATGLGMAAVGAPLHGPHLPLPGWCAPVADAISRVVNYASGPLIMLLVMATAWRQRFCGRWPALGVVIAALFGTVTTLAVVVPHNDHRGEISVMMGIAFPAVLQSARFLASAAIAAISLGILARRRSPAGLGNLPSCRAPGSAPAPHRCFMWRLLLRCSV